MASHPTHVPHPKTRRCPYGSPVPLLACPSGLRWTERARRLAGVAQLERGKHVTERACMTGNRTWRYLRSTSEKRGYDGEEFVPRSLLADPTFVKRLSYKIFAANAEDREHLADNIVEVAPEVSFFLDT